MIDRTPPGTSGRPPQPPRSRRSWVGLIILAVIILAIFVSCVSNASKPQSVTSSAPEVSKYTQTWPQTYSKTTCADWTSKLTSAQKFSAAADILTSARNKIDGGTGLPPDSLIAEFSQGITNVCISPTMSLTDATYGLYSTELRFHP